ncbi:S41 family peptidase [Hyphobacterium sp.]|uniref:S41 family peptidase n=1 Tax=Hyphobacterium sp. TaxID=2004662 RepID=UPI003749E159
MIKLLPRSAAILFSLAASLVFTQACAQDPTETIPADALRADVEEWRDWFFATHPDPSFSADVDDLQSRFDAVSNALEGEYSRREAWLSLAVLNPVFNDGHITIRAPQDDYDAYLAAGGAEFTLPVSLDAGRLKIAHTVAPESVFEAGEEILTINGHPAADLANHLMARMNGDSDGLRAYVLESRFPLYLWALTGGADSWTVVVASPGGSQRTVRLDPDRDTSVEPHDQWSLDFQGTTAVLTVNTFMPDLESEFAEFLETSFAAIAEQGAENLIIDVSRNGGGAHQLSDRLFAYTTDQRYTPLSAVTARIVAENQALIPGSEIGQVVSVPFAQWVEPPAELANRFGGNVAILVGAGTYSQAIVMAATAQDFDIAPVAGPGTEGRANSTGQVQLHRLIHSDLEVAAPIYIFIRPSGDRSSAPVIPDIPLSGTRDEQINQLIEHLTGHEN